MEANPPEREFLDHLERHQTLIRRVAGLYAHGADERRDLVQEILYQLWRSWPRFRREAKVETWMYRIALNTALTRRRRARVAPAQVSLEVEDRALASDARPAEQRDRVRSLHEAIRELDPTDRAVVMLHLEELPHRDIGEVLGISENLVNVKLHRIRERLRSMLKGTIHGE